MGLFEDLGRKVETFKKQAEEASRERASADCDDCGEVIYSDRDACPECGSEQITPRETGGVDEPAETSGVDATTDTDDATTADDEDSGTVENEDDRTTAE